MTAPSQSRPSVAARLRARPRLLVGGGVLAVAGVAFVLWWFQPQALLFDRIVDEGFPAAVPAPDTAPAGDEDGGAPGPEEPTGPSADAEDGEKGQDPDFEAGTQDEVAEPVGPRLLYDGNFASRNRYTVTGSASVYELEDGTRTLRLEPFESTNGPDLFVYLAAADHAADDPALDADYVDLGQLRGNIGSQNYAIPADIDLANYDTVVIWCRRFSSSFGAADLAAADE
jgi:hypothetical protein